jgi:hypothetical protein
MRRIVVVNDKMQKGYTYEVVALPGRDFHPDFKPQLSPKEMLELGVFGGKYMTDCRNEFPSDWFVKAKLAVGESDENLNYFKVRASQSLAEWVRKGWINEKDPRGWFQWYCRYYMGRRIDDEDIRQIKRWRGMRRHIGQIAAHCRPGDEFCRLKQRQALLHWAYDSRKI